MITISTFESVEGSTVRSISPFTGGVHTGVTDCPFPKRHTVPLGVSPTVTSPPLSKITQDMKILRPKASTCVKRAKSFLKILKHLPRCSTTALFPETLQHVRTASGTQDRPVSCVCDHHVFDGFKPSHIERVTDGLRVVSITPKTIQTRPLRSEHPVFTVVPHDDLYPPKTLNEDTVAWSPGLQSGLFLDGEQVAWDDPASTGPLGDQGVLDIQRFPTERTHTDTARGRREDYGLKHTFHSSRLTRISVRMSLRDETGSCDMTVTIPLACKHWPNDRRTG
ncbi:putative E3 ubiquitin-protein ligase NHLRC1-like [Triplophysa rosa]|uniref:E3 ubiquitin-protein ligase NHLRC1-like n=1 Tax=Triplophysa rosa TaxID=992332 RepID=A0A9W7WPX6_TRIRA|nr:putative E3 ubiquitin-protein ligase NHLRC1-like [Triplophysa rosa]